MASFKKYKDGEWVLASKDEIIGEYGSFIYEKGYVLARGKKYLIKDIKTSESKGEDDGHSEELPE